jgi:hypothetical protein
MDRNQVPDPAPSSQLEAIEAACRHRDPQSTDLVVLRGLNKDLTRLIQEPSRQGFADPV